MARRFRARHKWPWFVLLLAAAILGRVLYQRRKPAPPEVLPAGVYQVEKTLSADTLLLSNAAQVRLLGVEALATSVDHGTAGWSLAEFVPDHAVRLELDRARVDMTGQFLAYIWVVDPSTGQQRLLNEELLRAGLVRFQLHSLSSEAMKRRLRAAEQAAQSAKRGIWSE